MDVTSNKLFLESWESSREVRNGRVRSEMIFSLEQKKRPSVAETQKRHGRNGPEMRQLHGERCWFVLHSVAGNGAISIQVLFKASIKDDETIC